ncbi:MAG: hypothetical protein R6V44_05975 [Paracoccaceae bacterium]
MALDGLHDPLDWRVPAGPAAAGAARAAEAALARSLPPGARWHADLRGDPLTAAHHEAFRAAHAAAVHLADEAGDDGAPWELEDDGAPFDESFGD